MGDGRSLIPRHAGGTQAWGRQAVQTVPCARVCYDGKVESIEAEVKEHQAPEEEGAKGLPYAEPEHRAPPD